MRFHPSCYLETSEIANFQTGQCGSSVMGWKVICEFLSGSLTSVFYLLETEVITAFVLLAQAWVILCWQVLPLFCCHMGSVLGCMFRFSLLHPWFELAREKQISTCFQTYCLYVKAPAQEQRPDGCVGFGLKWLWVKNSIFQRVRLILCCYFLFASCCCS